VKERLMRGAVRAAMSQDWFVRMVARKRQAGSDAVLDPQIAAALEFDRIAKLPRVEDMEPIEARKYVADGLSALEPDPAPMAQVIDTQVNRIPVRLYVPYDAGPDWLVYFHGGGGVIGSIQTADPFARYVAAHTRLTIASVEYRLGPEHKHPAAIDDAIAAWEGLLARVPKGSKVAVGGDSFGGFLAAHVDHRARERRIRQPDVQLLLYPLVDLTLTSPSIERLGEGYMLTKNMVYWFRGHYLNEWDDQKAGSPWYWPDVKGSAPAIVATAGFDPLVDEGNAWAQRLRDAGVAVRHHCYESLVHGFISMIGAVTAARSAVDQLCADLVENKRS
jgi:acetyl esterase